MVSIAIIGMGPRGSSLLERLVTHTIETQSQHLVHFILFEKERELGPGCHYTHLQEDLLTNTIAAQMTMYFGDGMEAHGPVHNGDCLYDWYRKNRDPNVKSTDYLSRRSLGEYLRDFYLSQISRMQKHNIDYQIVQEEVIDVIDLVDQVEIRTKNSNYVASQAVLCVGHQAVGGETTNGFEDFLDYEELEKIENKQSVAIQGMGLTAFDVISRFTEGRGGHYRKISDTQLEYRPSGNEPKLYLFSRNGVFNSGCAFNSDPDFIYSPTYFTKDSIKALRGSNGALDFDRDVLPLLKQELEHAYAGKTGGEQLDMDMFFNPEQRVGGDTQEDFRNSFLSYLRWDIEQCVMGKMDSAYKFCQDAVRDLRDQFRATIDFRGLTEKSYDRFQNYWNPKFLKICVGPPYIRLMQLEALIKAGICSVDFAFNPRIVEGANRFTLICDYKNECKETTVQHVVKACIPSMKLCDMENPLARNLLSRHKAFTVGGLQYGGLEVNRSYEVFDSNGNACKNIHAFGIPTEGAKYFTLVLGRPNMLSTFLLDSNNLAGIILDKIFTGQQLKQKI